MSDDLQTLRGALLHHRWQAECEVIPAYRAPHERPDTKSRCVVRHIPSGRFLRHSRGPRTGTFWDVYGEDFLTEALAIVELSKAPAPIMAISAERRRAILELPTHTIGGERYVAREDLVKAIDGVIFTPLPSKVRRSAELPDDDPSSGEEASTHVAGWGANSRLREVHVTDGITVRLNDTQLEARSAGGTWQPLTLSRIPRSHRTALAELLSRPIEESTESQRPGHASHCRVLSGGVCTCRSDETHRLLAWNAARAGYLKGGSHRAGTMEDETRLNREANTFADQYCRGRWPRLPQLYPEATRS